MSLIYSFLFKHVNFYYSNFTSYLIYKCLTNGYQPFTSENIYDIYPFTLDNFFSWILWVKLNDWYVWATL